MLGHNRVAIMQPYFLPYIGYWQLMNHVETFVVYDNIEYTKKGWINRNRYLLNGNPETFTLPLKRDSDYLDVRQRQLADTFPVDKQKLLRRFEMAYRKAPHLEAGMGLINTIFSYNRNNLFEFIFHSIAQLRSALEIQSKLVVSSSLDLPRTLKGQERVIAICNALNATDYINPIGGTALYDAMAFLDTGIHLRFQKVRPITYQQFDHDFVPCLSIIDHLMFNGIEVTIGHLGEMDLLVTAA